MNIAAFHKPFFRRTPEQWQQILNDQAVSSLPQKAYCRQHGLSLTTFCNWKKKLTCHQSLHNTNTTESPANEWVAIPDPDSESCPNRWDMELELPGGVKLRMRQA